MVLPCGKTGCKDTYFFLYGKGFLSFFFRNFAAQNNSTILFVMKWTKYKIIYIALIVVFLVVMTFFAPASFRKRFALRREQRSIDEQIEHYEKEIDKTEKRLYELTESDTTLERYAREEYNMQADDETVYIIEESEE